MEKKAKPEREPKFTRGQRVRLSPVGATMRAGDVREEGIILGERVPHWFTVRWPNGEDTEVQEGWLEEVT
jgi:phospholipase C